MNKSLFTTEEILTLSQNPFTRKATEHTLSFTVEFKQFFMKKYNEGITPRQILIDCGYEPGMLGDRRIWGISRSIRKQYEVSNGTFSKGSSVLAKVRNQSEAKSVKEELHSLQQQIKYQEQEMAYLKKIISLKTTRK